MKIGIVYATKRDAATAEIAKWMSGCFESLGCEVVKKKPEDFNSFDCDVYVLGTAVYGFSAKRAGLGKFIQKNLEKLLKKPVAVFIVCGASHLKKEENCCVLKRKLKEIFINPDKYLESVVSLLRNTPVEKAIFKGYENSEDRKKVNFDNQKTIAESWCKAIAKQAK